MFAKTKCLMVLSRTGRYVQSRSIRKNSQFRYSAAPAEGLSSTRQVKTEETLSTSLEGVPDPLDSVGKYNELHLSPKEYTDSIIAAKKIKLDEVIRKAEELLGCQFHKSKYSPLGIDIRRTDVEDQKYFNLLPDWFQSDSSQISARIPALLGTGHPILKLKQNIDPDAEEHALTVLSNNVQWRALVVMLVAKAFGCPNSSQDKKIIEARQITLSEISEMMHFAFTLHRSIVETDRSKSNEVTMEEKESTLHLGNKIGVLLGDLLLARTSKGLSSIQIAKVTELMSDAISDFSESEVLRRQHLDFFKPVPSSSSDLFKELTGHLEALGNCIEVPSFETWRKRVQLDLASLIGRSCLCSTLISQHDEGANNLAFIVGRHIGLVMQAYNDLELYTRSKNLERPVFDLCTLPLIFHLNSNSVDRIHKPTDVSEIYRSVMTSSKALKQTQDALKHLKEESVELISKLPRTTPASQILVDFISVLS